MAECLYYGDKPIGLIQSNADDVEYSTGVSVKDKIDELEGKIIALNISDSTDSNGNLNTNLLASEYVYLGTNFAASFVSIALNAMSDGKIRVAFRGPSDFAPIRNAQISATFFFLKIN